MGRQTRRRGCKPADSSDRASALPSVDRIVRRSARLAAIAVAALARAQYSSSQRQSQQDKPAVQVDKRERTSFKHLPAELLLDIAYDVAGHQELWQDKRTLLGYRLVHRAFAPYITAALISTSTVLLDGFSRPAAVQLMHLIKQPNVGQLVRSLSFIRKSDYWETEGLDLVDLHNLEALQTIATCLQWATRAHILHLSVGIGFAGPSLQKLFSPIRSFAYEQCSHPSDGFVRDHHLARWIAASSVMRQLEIRTCRHVKYDKWPKGVIALCREKSFKTRAAAIEQPPIKTSCSSDIKDTLRYVRFSPVSFYAEVVDTSAYWFPGDPSPKPYDWLFKALQDARFTRRMKRAHIQIIGRGRRPPSSAAQKLEGLLQSITRTGGIQTSCTYIDTLVARAYQTKNTIPWLVEIPEIGGIVGIPGLASAPARVNAACPDVHLA